MIKRFGRTFPSTHHCALVQPHSARIAVDPFECLNTTSWLFFLRNTLIPLNEEADYHHHYSLLFFQGTADVLAGLEAIRIHSGCEWTHQVHTEVHPVDLSEGSVTATCSVGPNKDENVVKHSVLLFKALSPSNSVDGSYSLHTNSPFNS